MRIHRFFITREFDGSILSITIDETNVNMPIFATILTHTKSLQLISNAKDLILQTSLLYDLKRRRESRHSSTGKKIFPLF